jgi:hypothetical protein
MLTLRVWGLGRYVGSWEPADGAAFGGLGRARALGGGKPDAAQSADWVYRAPEPGWFSAVLLAEVYPRIEL